MDRNRVVIHIAGKELAIMSGEQEEYVQKLADQLDHSIRELLSQDSSMMTVTTAAILTALSALDDALKAQQGADELRLQVNRYLEEMSENKALLDEANRELDRTRKELDKTREEYDRLRKELEEGIQTHL